MGWRLALTHTLICVFVFPFRKLSQDLSTHVSARWEGVLGNWIDNRIREVVIAAQPMLAGGDGLKQAIRAHKATLGLNDPHLPLPLDPLVWRFRALKALFEAALLLPTKEARTRTLLNLFLDLQREIGVLYVRALPLLVCVCVCVLPVWSASSCSSLSLSLPPPPPCRRSRGPHGD
jgi:hypothetical protein